MQKRLLVLRIITLAKQTAVVPRKNGKHWAHKDGRPCVPTFGCFWSNDRWLATGLFCNRCPKTESNCIFTTLTL